MHFANPWGLLALLAIPRWRPMIGLYALAKLLEHFDGVLFAAIGFSGHTLKHLAAAAALAVATATVFPFEMDTVVGLSGNRLVATHYGLYNTVVGVGNLIGNLATGALYSIGNRIGFPGLIWLVLIGIGVACTTALQALYRSGSLDRGPVPARDR